ncbi:MAG: hypothetical protein ABSD64_05090 [Terriglobales bacterium]|jgi:hypothetical protein
MDHEKPHRSPSNGDRERYYDDSDDLAARVRRARAAFQRELEAFGDVSEYEVRFIHGQRTDIVYGEKKNEEAAAAAPETAEIAPQSSSQKETRANADRQTTLEFGSDAPQSEEQ